MPDEICDYIFYPLPGLSAIELQCNVSNEYER